MTAPILSSGLLTSALLLLTACTVDVGRSAASATEGRSPPWAVTLQRQSSIAGSGLHEIDESDLRSGDLLFSSSLVSLRLGSAPSAPLPLATSHCILARVRSRKPPALAYR